VSEIFDIHSREEQQAVRRTEITITPISEEQAGRIGFGTMKGVTKATATHGRDVLYPLILIARGLRCGIAWFHGWWRATSKDRRRLALVIVAIPVAVAATRPYGLWILAGAVMVTAGIAGRGPRTAETPQQLTKLQTIYNGLVPYFTDPHDPDQLFQPGGEFRRAFDAWYFDQVGRLIKLDLHYSPFFRDGDQDARSQIERTIERKTGQTGEYAYEWNEEQNTLAVAIMPWQRNPA
jgi:hypothetical protein